MQRPWYQSNANNLPYLKCVLLSLKSTGWTQEVLLALVIADTSSFNPCGSHVGYGRHFYGRIVSRGQIEKGVWSQIYIDYCSTT